MKISRMQLGIGLIIGIIMGIGLSSFSGTLVTPADETTATITTTTSITKSITTTNTAISTSIITATVTTTINNTTTLTETITSTVSTTLTTTATVTTTKIIIESLEFLILSPSFGDNEDIPLKFTCDSQNISPELIWSTPPEGTESIVLIMDDPDAPGSFTHWVLFNIPAHITELPEGVPSQNVLEKGGTHGRNGLGAMGYFGPCPPAGPEHRYKFRIYAIDTVLSLEAGATKQMVLSAISGHILDEALLTGKFGR